MREEQGSEYDGHEEDVRYSRLRKNERVGYGTIRSK